MKILIEYLDIRIAYDVGSSHFFRAYSIDYGSLCIFTF